MRGVLRGLRLTRHRKPVAWCSLQVYHGTPHTQSHLWGLRVWRQSLQYRPAHCQDLRGVDWAQFRWRLQA